MKAWLQDFPATNAGHALALLLVLFTGLVVTVRLALGRVMPDGYGEWFMLLGALAGVSTIGTIGKRLSDIDYKKAGTSPVTVEAPSTVTVTAPAKEEGP
jgi:hypothetical protein